MTSTTAMHHLALVPRDGLFCKDGRGWHTSASGRGHALDWPWPSTILGALRTAWGRGAEQPKVPFDWRTETSRISLGRTLVLRRQIAQGCGTGWTVGDRVWPAPADGLWLEGREHVHPLLPRGATLRTLGREVGDAFDIAREKLWVPHVDDPSKPRSPPRWWSEDNLVAWLSGGLVKAGTKITPDPGSFNVQRRVQSHVGIDGENLTSVDGVLFAHDVVETLEKSAEWAIAAEISLPDGKVPSIVTLGADGRLANVESVADELFEPPVGLLSAFGSQPTSGIRLVIATPAEFKHGWLPDGFDDVRDGKFRGSLTGVAGELFLRAAFVGRPVHLSGWDMALGEPKRTSRMVPPGSVYFFERIDGGAFGEAEARALWLTAIGERTEEGFGRGVPGVWHPNGRGR